MSKLIVILLGLFSAQLALSAETVPMNESFAGTIEGFNQSTKAFTVRKVGVGGNVPGSQMDIEGEYPVIMWRNENVFEGYARNPKDYFLYNLDLSPPEELFEKISCRVGERNQRRAILRATKFDQKVDVFCVRIQ